MPLSFKIRLATENDAEGILQAHFSAVHETARCDYAADVLTIWSKPVDAARIAARQAKLRANRAIVSYVAVDQAGHALGYGELLPPETLGAVYVAASAGRRGVGSALLAKLERKARDLDMKVLRMESSLTAVAFYTRHGFREVDRMSKQLAPGVLMACVKMEKAL